METLDCITLFYPFWLYSLCFNKKIRSFSLIFNQNSFLNINNDIKPSDLFKNAFTMLYFHNINNKHAGTQWELLKIIKDSR